MTNNSSQDVSKLEVLSMMRDAKRRRQSYRGIHTARKSYTEVLREIIAQQTEILTASQELSEQQSEDRRSSSVESLSNKPENLHKSRCSHKYKTQNPSRIHRYSPSNSPSSSSSSSTTTTRRNNETCRKTSKSTLKHTHHHSSKWNDKRQSSPSSSSKHRTSSKEMNKRSHHDSVDIHDNDEVDSPLHKKLKKHKKHSKHKHKHKSKK
uniref:U11/U12 small nuclear ribonucleoprotein 48 kDa protein n=1 Tax=Schistosoma mansoni TaxID=6183 RepID=A0A5K4ELN6_SCHMA